MEISQEDWIKMVKLALEVQPCEENCGNAFCRLASAILAKASEEDKEIARQHIQE